MVAGVAAIEKSISELLDFMTELLKAAEECFCRYIPEVPTVVPEPLRESAIHN